jgi:hypothetical protein
MQHLKQFLQIPYGKGFPLIGSCFGEPYKGSMRHITATLPGMCLPHPASRHPKGSDLSVQLEP